MEIQSWRDQERYRRGTDERNGQEKQRLWISIKHREPQTLIPKKNEETERLSKNRR